MLFYGELQFDVEWDDANHHKKAPASPLKTLTDIFVFPNLDVGNIGYKSSQRLGGF
ncbi:phosphate acyltransferase [Spiroplasma endosymbiont of Polydrusus formosus]|uniref:phosphate acyltransferase n=1 Tax=Spiroplasma endosymbiont of Polydrusus formosus TaxID=3139326 RepID=UPI0035B53A8E